MAATRLALALALLSSTAAAQEPQPLLGDPVQGLTASERLRFDEGLAAFGRPITEAEGLGPGFNGRSCLECHSVPAPGGHGGPGITLFGRANPPATLGQLGGPLLQAFSISPGCQEVIPGAATLIIPRETPSLFGLGLLEAIPDADILAREAAQPAGLNGYSQLIVPTETPGGTPRVGRMGRKGRTATVMSFSIGGARNELGLTSPFLTNESAPNGDAALLAACDTVSDPEDNVSLGNGMLLTERVTDFQRLLAAPAQTPRTGHPGEAIFGALGCAGCHESNWTSGAVGEAALSSVPVRAYSDFLVHDMGALGDGFAIGPVAARVQPTELMTRPLWGMVHRPALLHDGRASGGTPTTRARTAILEHDGEALPSRNAFAGASAGDQDLLLAFLNTLGRAEFDVDVDNDRDLDDWAQLAALLNGPAPASPHGPGSPGAVADVNQDGDFDLVEFLQFQEVFGDGPVQPASPVLLDLEAVSGGSPTVVVPAGAQIPVDVRGRLVGGPHRGLAGFALDMAFDGGPMMPLAPPGPVLDFVGPSGVTNPGGFGGTLQGGALLQLGGAQNTILNSGGAPNGTVRLDVGSSPNPVFLARGAVEAPMTPGTYTISITDVRATAIAGGATGTPYWEVVRADAGNVTDLTVIVEDIGVNYCASNPNSSGDEGTLGATGSALLTANDVNFLATHLPVGQFGLFAMAPNQGLVPNFAGSQGNLCLGSAIVRFNADIAQTDGRGMVSFSPDLGSLPQGTTFLAGEQWNFQFWFRDLNPGLTSNTTNGYAITFQ